MKDKFFNNIIFTDNCWIWKGVMATNGYGIINHKRKRYYAHRISVKLLFGVDPGSLFVCHHCDNPKCVNPAHLFLGTASDNFQDCLKKGRVKGNAYKNKNKSYCIRNHEFNKKNTYFTSNGRRNCRPCDALFSKKYREQKK